MATRRTRLAPPTNRFRYTARDFDTETGLYYYRAGYYDPTTGRFLAEDPARFNVGANFYSYVGNNSSDFTDPTGLDPCDKGKCPPAWLQSLYGSLISSNPATQGMLLEGLGLARATGTTVVIGVGGNAGGALWPGGMLGGSVGASVGLGVDPCGDIGLVISGQLGGGYNPSLPGSGTPVYGNGGGSFTYTNQPTIFGLGGSSPVIGASGGDEVGGSVTHTLGGSTTVTVGAGFGFGTFGGVKGTEVFPLVCSSNCN